MPPQYNVYVAGVGLSPSTSPGKEFVLSLISAATKALLDAGVTYDDVTHCVLSSKASTSSHASDVFKSFDERSNIPVVEAETGTEFDQALSLIQDRRAQCVLMTVIEGSSAVALVLVSDSFLWSHPYLKDSSALIAKSEAPRSKMDRRAREKLADVCQMVWVLRGWSQTRGIAGKKGRFYYTDTRRQAFELSRANGQPVPEWNDVEYKQDGKHRLGYNPATETKEVSQEDIEAVRATGVEHSKTGAWTHFRRVGGDIAALSRL